MDGVAGHIGMEFSSHVSCNLLATINDHGLETSTACEF